MGVSRINVVVNTVLQQHAIRNSQRRHFAKENLMTKLFAVVAPALSLTLASIVGQSWLDGPSVLTPLEVASVHGGEGEAGQCFVDDGTAACTGVNMSCDKAGTCDMDNNCSVAGRNHLTKQLGPYAKCKGGQPSGSVHCTLTGQWCNLGSECEVKCAFDNDLDKMVCTEPPTPTNKNNRNEGVPDSQTCPKAG